MINASDVKFGRRIPEDRSYEQKYDFKKLSAVAPTNVEKILKLPNLVDFYCQGNMNACVGFSCSWMMSIFNQYNIKMRYSRPKPAKPFEYDAVWLYTQARLNDGWPFNDPPKDEGTYLWAGFWTLQHLGLKKINENKPDLNDGLLSYYWSKNADGGRTAIDLGKPFAIGVDWYERFMTPKEIDGQFWIGTESSFGNMLGGHAICVYGASDEKQAFKLVNSWGKGYPTVWLPYKIFNTLMNQGGEMCVGIDNPKFT